MLVVISDNKLETLEKQLNELCNEEVRETEYDTIGYTLLNLGFNVTVVYDFGCKKRLRHVIGHHAISVNDIFKVQEFINKRVVLNHGKGVATIIKTLVSLGIAVSENNDGSYTVYSPML